ncbi:response regulator [Alkalicoccobacillus murimartini]|uniref:Two-component system NarL family response regulator n=1 Tax=Alkalicoccobacillus murimartini TaxID=171685 RepID=A0ABT9YKR9_9BACI|nr:response regulator transcription factor [Alkalicoccobacillus murimartini]MDQ0207629.1 two-component system NarL family response regulator [Alkalicoccobacillus murimartini]
MKLLIVDDHQMVRKGLVYFLEMTPNIKIVGEAANGQEAVTLYERLLPDVVLMDIDMPVMNGIDATRYLVKKWPRARILIVTSFADQDYVIPALQAGASGYQLKDVEPEELVETIKAVHQGESKLHPHVMKHVLSHVSEDSTKKRLGTLTEREVDVLKEISTGKSNKEIAEALIISEKTVKTHVSNLLSKLELQDRTQAALFAIQAGVAKPTML